MNYFERLNMTRRGRPFVLLTMTLLIAGCGGSSDAPPTAKVTGTLTFEGKPASDILVTFNPTDGGRQSTGKSDSDGKYTLVYNANTLGAKIGKHKVTLTAELPRDSGSTGKGMLVGPTPIPKEYNESPKEIEVTKGSNTIDLAYP